MRKDYLSSKNFEKKIKNYLVFLFILFIIFFCFYVYMTVKEFFEKLFHL